jgi:hypothetical protein
VQQDDQPPLAGLDIVQSLIADIGVAIAKSGGLGHDHHPRGTSRLQVGEDARGKAA